MPISLNKQIFWGVFVGITGGILLNILGTDSPMAQRLIFGCGLIGGIFIDLLKMILIPLIFTSIAVGIANLPAHTQMNRVWKLTLIYFLTTTSLASLLGLITVNLFQPGVGLKTALFQDAMMHFKYENLTVAQFFKSFCSELFMNPVKAMAEGKIFPTLLFAIFLGIALIVSGKKGEPIQKALNDILDLIMLMVSWIMRVAPLGIMALLLKLISTQDISLLSMLGKFILVVVGATLFHGIVILPSLLYLITRMTPLQFFRGAKEALITAFSTSSSSATLPITLRCTQENLKVKKEIAGFVVPLGATVNMDGTALYEAIAAIFVANLTGIELTLTQQIIVFFMSILASIGAPGIPSAGMVTMIMVLQAVGLPAEAVAILIPIDRFLDTIRTAVNVQGDLIGSVVVMHLTKDQDKT